MKKKKEDENKKKIKSAKFVVCCFVFCFLFYEKSISKFDTNNNDNTS